ncbi:MAG: diadenylate cyclase CdaA [Oscillospiraceae bacterium]|nr:diadenylate cyclase CdaA [Oscillospiraceae bacterium]
MDVMTYISDIFQNLVRVVLSITFFDIIDILLLTYLVYMVIKLMKETRAEQLMKGILILVLMFMVVQVCQLKVMSFIFENFFQVGIIAIVVVFQPELRRILERVGRAKVPNISLGADSDVQSSRARDEAIAGIAEACERLHMTKTGALIVVERQTKIGDITEKATIINAAPEPDLFCNLFYNKAPLHDGAVVIRDNRIYAAGCFLPNTNKDQYLSSDLGSRHRAAIGMSENADSLVIVVSEETGTISVAENGQLTRGLSKEALTKILQRKMPEGAVRVKKRTRKPKPEAPSADN